MSAPAQPRVAPPPADGHLTPPPGDLLIRRFDEIDRGDVPTVGGKGANLGEMTHLGLPVPPGFVLTVDAYRRFRDAARLGEAIDALAPARIVDDPAALQRAADRLRQLVREAPVPDDVGRAVLDAYHTLEAGEGDALVAVRSSATAEDTADFSFAGMFESFVGVRGEAQLLQRVRDCWASTFGARVLFYRIKQGMSAEMPVAVIVQRMIDADSSGVIFTADPATHERGRIIIEASWGLGESVVSGQVTPDRYVLDKDSLVLREMVIARKESLMRRDAATGEVARIPLLEDDDRATARVLGDAAIHSLGELARRTEMHYGVPQDLEFAIAGERIYLVQTRPITTLARSPASAPASSRPAPAPAPAPTPASVFAPPTGAAILAHGLGASPGVASGVVRVLASPSDAGALRAGEILVTRTTTPDWVPVMRRAAAIVTDSGGMTSHAAIVSRELGIPCVVGTREGTRVLHDGLAVTVDGASGTIVAGTTAARATPPTSIAPEATRTSATGAASRPESPAALPAVVAPVTATRIYVNLAEPERAEEIAARAVDGVGLLRAEFMMLEALERRHPRQLLAEGRAEEFVTRMADGLRRFARAFHPRPVIYRAMDFRSNEFRALAGGEAHEPTEENPMIGYRGCFRYTREPDLFALELEALHRVRAELGNLHLMIPFVRTGWELRECRRLLDTSPLGADRNLQLWIMAEVPSVVTWLPAYAAAGITGVSIGSNDLTQLVLGVDRDGELVSPLYDERDAAVLATIRAIIAESHRLGLTCSICGQAPSVYPEYAAQLVRWGIDSISVNPDVIDVTRRNVAAAELRLLLDAARSEDGRDLTPPARASRIAAPAPMKPRDGGAGS